MIRRLLIGLAIAVSAAHAAAPEDPARHAFDRARWSIARDDTTQAVDLLRAIDTNTGPATRAVLLRLSLDDVVPPVELRDPKDGERAWHTFLRWEQGEVPSPIPSRRTAAETILLAAAALDEGDPATTRRLLEELGPRRPWHVIALHLRVLAARDDAEALALRTGLARLEADSAADRALIEDAALRVGAVALQRGEDPSAWFERLGDDGVAASWAAWLRALEANDAGMLDTWLAEYSDHPGVTEARLRRAGLALDTGDDARARELHLQLETALDARAAELASIERDSTRFATWSVALWTGARRLTPDPAAWGHGRDALVHELSLDRNLPKTGDLPFAVGTANSATARVDDDALTEHERLDALRAAAQRAVDRARRELAAAASDASARAAYRDRGLDRLAELSDALASSGRTLDGLIEETPQRLAALRAVEDSLLARIDRRTRSLGARATAHAERARDLARWYGRGPMARRDPAKHPEVPIPANHLDDEERFARSMRATIDTLGTNTPEVVRRSFSDVFARRLDEGAARMRTHADSLAARAATADAMMLAARDSLDRSPELIAARTALDAARSARDDAAHALARHRETTARAILAQEIETLEIRREAVAYGNAIATTNLALAGDSGLREEARSRWSEFVGAGCDPRVRGDARYRWADLELVAAREDFQQRMGRWLDEEGRGERAMAPLLDIEPALALFRDILDEDPGFAHRDLVLLHLGMLHADRGDPEAAAYLTRLVEEHPDSPRIAEAQLRRGEIAFDAGDYEAARGPLRAATSATDPELRAVALYKAGWSAHATGRLLESIDTFDALLDLYASDDAPTSFDLADEARQLYLRAVARAGGAPAFASSLERNGERDDAPQLLADLSALLTEYALHEQAAAADELYLDRYPTDPGALDAARRWIDDEARRAGVPAADAAMLAIVDRYEPDGVWFAAQGDSLRAEGATFARDGLVGVAVRRHETVRESPTARGWRDTRDLYVRLTTTWPADADLTKWSLLAGECALAVDDHASAFEHFAVAARDSGEIGEQAAWQTVATTDAWYRTSIPAGAKVGADSLARRFVDQADAYRARRPRAEGNADLAWRALRVTLAHGWDDDVIARTVAFVDEHPDDPRRVDASRLHAEALYRGEDYLQASRAFELAMTRARSAGRDSVATALATWVPHSFELHVDQVERDAPADAAPLWRNFADRWPDHESAETALYRSGLGFESAGNDSLALDAWRVVIARHPEGEYAQDAHRNLARTLESTGDVGAAVTALVAFADAHPDATDAADALLHAVDLREKQGDGAGRDELLDLYLDRHPEDLQTLQAVREERARVAIEAGTSGPEVTAYLAFAAAHPDRASKGLLAQHAFQQADRAWDGYAALTLTQPLEPSLERKRDALTGLLDSYREVAERGVAPWAQQATTRIGEALLLMGDALVDSERPAGLSGDDRLAYDEVLEEQAWTFHERGESALREVLRHRDPEDEADWASHARQLLFPRIAQRFLHQPSFDYPVLESGETTGNDEHAWRIDPSQETDGASDLQPVGR